MESWKTIETDSGSKLEKILQTLTHKEIVAYYNAQPSRSRLALKKVEAWVPEGEAADRYPPDLNDYPMHTVITRFKSIHVDKKTLNHTNYVMLNIGASVYSENKQVEYVAETRSVTVYTVTEDKEDSVSHRMVGEQVVDVVNDVTAHEALVATADRVVNVINVEAGVPHPVFKNYLKVVQKSPIPWVENFCVNAKSFKYDLSARDHIYQLQKNELFKMGAIAMAKLKKADIREPRVASNIESMEI